MSNALSSQENNPQWATDGAAHPEQVRKEYLNGSERWRAGLDELRSRPGQPVSYAILDSYVNGRWRDVFRAWKRHHAGGAWNTRPFHIARLHDGSYVAWMDEAQVAALADV